MELTPLLAEEVKAAGRAVDPLWIRGGFPDSFLARGDDASYQWRLAFIRTYLERDIPTLGPRVPAETLRRFWTMLSHAQGTLLNHSTLASSLGISGQTITRYAIVTEVTSSDAESGAIYSKGKSICEYFDDAKLHDVFAKYEKLAKITSSSNR